MIKLLISQRHGKIGQGEKHDVTTGESAALVKLGVTVVERTGSYGPCIRDHLFPGKDFTYRRSASFGEKVPGTSSRLWVSFMLPLCLRVFVVRLNC